MKVADVMLVFGKEDPNNNANYRPISLLSVILKIFERALFGHIEKFAKKKKSYYQNFVVLEKPILHNMPS